jgi:hypothetical protein
LARCFHNSYRFHRVFFDYRPEEKVTLLLQDFGDYGQGGADVVPRNRVSVALSPFNYAYETMPSNERMNWLMNHELVHIVATDRPSGRDRLFRNVFFGKVNPNPGVPVSTLYSYLTNPRRFSPRWYHEGIAVFLETWMAGGMGRALGAYDEMVFRSMVRDGSYIYHVVGLESEGTTVDFQAGVNSYLYGTRFVSYLVYEYGPRKLLDWMLRSDGTAAYFATQFKKVYGRSLGDEWSSWIEWEQKWQAENLVSIRKHPTTDYYPVTKTALGSVSRAYYDASRGELYAAIRYPGKVAHLAGIDISTGEIRKICDIKGASLYFVCSLSYDPATGDLFYTTDNNDWRDLEVINVETCKHRTLMKDARTGDLSFNSTDKSIWGVRHFNGISTLVRIPYPYEEWNQVFSFPYGTDIYDIDISPDGSILTGALVQINGTQQLVEFDMKSLLDGDGAYRTLFDFGNSCPESFVFGPEGRYLYGSSYYSGVSNIYRYDFEENDMDVLSNCETGFFRPVPVSSDSLVVFRYTGDGFVPVMIANESIEKVSAIKFLGQALVEKYWVLRRWGVGSPTSVDLSSLGALSGSYKPFRSIRLSSAYPVVEGYKDYPAYGVRFNFADPLLLHSIDLTASYSPDNRVPEDEKLHVCFNYGFKDYYLSATYNGADFYDLFGPTKASRKGYSVGLQYSKRLIFEPPKTMDATFHITKYGDLERMPSYQNVEATFNEFVTFVGRLSAANQGASLGAVDYEKGYGWRITSVNNHVDSELVPRVYATLDYGIPLPIGHSSIWLRSALGHSFGERLNPFANFYFGGFGNNWVDYASPKRYRNYDSFPGVEINDVGGTNFGKMLAEWTLPPVRFRRLGFTSCYLRWARTAVFASGIITNIDDETYQRRLVNLGCQMDFRLVTFSLFRSTLSVGYAIALEEHMEPSKEFMLSLKLL